jgi:MFS family permease
MYDGDLQARIVGTCERNIEPNLPAPTRPTRTGGPAVHNALSRKPIEVALPAYEPWYPVVRSIFGFFVFGVFSG